MKERFSKLIDVKTIVTFSVVGATIALAFTGKIEAKEISIMATLIIGFFFGSKINNNNT